MLSAQQNVTKINRMFQLKNCYYLNKSDGVMICNSTNRVETTKTPL